MSRARAGTESDSRKDRDIVTSLSRGLQIIGAFDPARPSMTLSELAARANINRAASRRLLTTLVRDGYAATDGKYFRLLPKVLDLSASVMASMDLSKALQAAVTDLSNALDESCFAAVLDGQSVVYVARSLCSRVINLNISIGKRAPAHAVSSGRVLLAGLSEEKLEDYFARAKLLKFTPFTSTSKRQLRTALNQVRRDGYSIVNQELEVRLQSISVPVFDTFGNPVAALNVCCPLPRVTLRSMKARILPLLCETAARVTIANRAT